MAFSCSLPQAHSALATSEALSLGGSKEVLEVGHGKSMWNPENNELKGRIYLQFVAV